MNAILVNWIPAETANARVPENNTVAVPSPQAAVQIQAAIDRVRRFEEQVLREAKDRPVMIVDRA